MRALAVFSLALALLALASPAEAHCHRFHIWNYPRPQRACTTAVSRAVLRPAPVAPVVPNEAAERAAAIVKLRRELLLLSAGEIR